MYRTKNKANKAKNPINAIRQNIVQLCRAAVIVALIVACLHTASSQAFAQDSARVYKMNQTLMTPAIGLSDATLGEVVDEKFKKIEKITTNAPFESTANVFTQTALNLDDATLAAAYAPLLAKLGVKPQAGKRYCVATVYRITKTKEVSLLTGGNQKIGGKFVAAKLHYGYAVQALLEADSATLNDRVGLRCLKRGSDLLKEAAKRGVAGKMALYGVQANVGGFYVPNNADDFARRYTAAPEPVPLFVEWNVTNDVTPERIAFADGRIHTGSWLVKTVNVVMEERKPNNNHWDPLLGKPDLVLSLELGKSIYATSKKYNNTFEAKWDVNTAMKLDKGQILQISVIDKDPAGDDYAGAIGIETDRLFNYEPGQEIYLSTKDEKCGIKSATVVLEAVRTKKK
jgi:hypothetical protein